MAIHEMFTYLCVKDASRAIQFYQEAFGASEKFRLTEPSGRIRVGRGFIAARITSVSPFETPPSMPPARFV